MKRITLTIFLFLAVAVAAAAQTNPNVTTSYDAGQDETTIEAAQIPVKSDRTNRFLGVAIAFKGKKLAAKPGVVMFIISSVNAKGHKYPLANELIFVADGKQLGKISILNLDQREFSPTEILETLGTNMPMDLFKKISTSKAPVTFSIAETPFTLDASVLAILVDFEKAITP